jgi:hypothetical protein
MCGYIDYTEKQNYTNCWVCLHSIPLCTTNNVQIHVQISQLEIHQQHMQQLTRHALMQEIS